MNKLIALQEVVENDTQAAMLMGSTGTYQLFFGHIDHDRVRFYAKQEHY